MLNLCINLLWLYVILNFYIKMRVGCTNIVNWLKWYRWKTMLRFYVQKHVFVMEWLILMWFQVVCDWILVKMTSRNGSTSSRRSMSLTSSSSRKKKANENVQPDSSRKAAVTNSQSSGYFFFVQFVLSWVIHIHYTSRLVSIIKPLFIDHRCTSQFLIHYPYYS